MSVGNVILLYIQGPHPDEQHLHSTDKFNWANQMQDIVHVKDCKKYIWLDQHNIDAIWWDCPTYHLKLFCDFFTVWLFINHSIIIIHVPELMS